MQISNMHYLDRITKKLISSFNVAKIEEIEKEGLGPVRFCNYDELSLKKENAANLLTTGKEKTPVIFHCDKSYSIVEETHIIDKNKEIRFLTQDLDLNYNYNLSIVEKTAEGVYWFDFHYHYIIDSFFKLIFPDEIEKDKTWGKICIYFRDNEYLKSKNLEVTHPVFYKLISNCYGPDKPIMETDIVFDNEEDLENFIIKASHIDIKNLYLQLKESEESKTESITKEVGRKR